MSKAQQTDGLLIIDKPAGFTSHDIVSRCRRVFSQRRVGHSGTLDPDATGVLLVGLGQATRLMQFLSGLPKHYRGEVVLGTSTDSLDSSGTVTGSWDMGHVTLEQVKAAAASLTGAILQIPPMVSAVKVEGRRLYELAREGVEVARQPRSVTVRRFEISQLEGDLAEDTQGSAPVFGIEVECSSGTYIRSLAADLGALLGGGAHLRHLRRLAVGPFDVGEAVTMEELEAAACALPLVVALRGMPQVVVDEKLASSVTHGRVLPLALLYECGASGSGPWAVLTEGGDLLAVYQEHRSGQAKPAVVMQTGS